LAEQSQWGQRRNIDRGGARDGKSDGPLTKRSQREKRSDISRGGGSVNDTEPRKLAEQSQKTQ